MEETCNSTEAHSSLSLYLGRSVQYSDDINDVPSSGVPLILTRREIVLGSADVIELAATATPGQRSIRQLAFMDRSLNSTPLEHVDKVRVQVLNLRPDGVLAEISQSRYLRVINQSYDLWSTARTESPVDVAFKQ